MCVCARLISNQSLNVQNRNNEADWFSALSLFGYYWWWWWWLWLCRCGGGSEALNHHLTGTASISPSFGIQIDLFSAGEAITRSENTTIPSWERAEDKTSEHIYFNRSRSVKNPFRLFPPQLLKVDGGSWFHARARRNLGPDQKCSVDRR